MAGTTAVRDLVEGSLITGIFLLIYVTSATPENGTSGIIGGNPQTYLLSWWLTLALSEYRPSCHVSLGLGVYVAEG